MNKRFNYLLLFAVLLFSLLQAGCAPGGSGSASYRLVLVSGGGQTGYMGRFLSQAIVVRVVDGKGNPRAGETLTVTLVSGGGRVEQNEITSDSSGQASVLWELGDEYRNRLRVTLQRSGVSDPPTLTVHAYSLYVYRAPDQLNDGWETAAIDGQTVDLPALLGVIDNIRGEFYENIHSILLVKAGKLVLEEYFPGFNSNDERIDFDRDTKHEVQSASKSFRSALIGIAIDAGFIRGVDEPLFSFYPEYGYLMTDTKSRITLEHVLTMSTGFEWHENDYPFSSSRNTLSQLYNLPSSQWSRFVLEQPMADEPGARWLYNTGSSLMLSDILTKVTGMRADYFADIYLFNKMESADQSDHWPPLATGLRPRDMAKFGYLFLNNGKWKETRIIPEEWIRISTQKHFQVNSNAGYGYLWWMRSFFVGPLVVESYYAAGNGGQYIFVLPSMDMVIVFTGGNFQSSLMTQVYDILEDFILPAFLQ
jgi:CubicO group peptidase (beta-lactamase class C family)